MSANCAAELDKILLLEGKSFVRVCYQKFLGHEPNTAGMNYHIELLNSGRSKISIAAGLSKTEEAIARGTARSQIANRVRLLDALERRSLPKTIIDTSLGDMETKEEYFQWIKHYSNCRSIQNNIPNEKGANPNISASYIAYDFWISLTRRFHSSNNNHKSLWIDLTSAFEWTAGIVSIIHTELQFAVAIKNLEPNVRFSMLFAGGFVEIQEADLNWLLSSNNVCDAYNKYFQIYNSQIEDRGTIKVQVPETKLFFHPYSENDRIFSAGWLDSRKEHYLSMVKTELKNISIFYMIYNIESIFSKSNYFHPRINALFKYNFLKWVSQNCDMLFFDGVDAKNECEAYQLDMGWQRLPGYVVKLEEVASVNHEVEIKTLNSIGITGPFIVVAYSLHKYSNHEVIYRAFKLAISLSSDKLPQLVIFGDLDNEISDLLDTMMRDEELKEFLVLCYPTEDIKNTINKECIFAIIPNIFDDWKNTLLEYSRFNKVCVIADMLDVRSVIGEAADYVEPLDVMGWAINIIKYSNKLNVKRKKTEYNVTYSDLKYKIPAKLICSQIKNLFEKSIHKFEVSSPMAYKYEIPNLWMDVTLSLIKWRGNISGIVRTELMYAKYLKQHDPNMRFFVFDDDNYFEINSSFMNWLDTAMDISSSYSKFQDYRLQIEATGMSFLNYIKTANCERSIAIEIQQWESNSIVFYAAIDFGKYKGSGEIELYRTQKIERLIDSDLSVMRSQLIYDFTPFLVPQFHTQETVDGYCPFIDFVSNNFDHIVYGGKTAQRDGIAIQEKNLWNSPTSDAIEFGSDLCKSGAAPNVDIIINDNAVLETLGVRPPFIIAVGTLEPRKNHVLLYQAYLIMQQQNLLVAPLQMIFIGSNGWKNNDLISTLEEDKLIKNKIIIISPNDFQLDILYRHCLFTLLPSFYEGWSLTLPESLSYGKFCLVSDVAPLREIGENLVEYINPLDSMAWAARIAYYANNVDKLSAREEKIKCEWKATTWEQSASMLLNALRRAHSNKFAVV